MSPTTKRGRIAAGTLTALALALSAPVSLQAKPLPSASTLPSSPAPGPVLTPAADYARDAAPMANPIATPVRIVEASPDPAPTPAEPSTATAPASPQAQSGGIYLRLFPDRDGVYMQELQRRLDAVRAGTQPMTYVTEWRDPVLGSLRDGIIQLRSRTDAPLEVSVTDLAGEPVALSLDADGLAALRPLIAECETAQLGQRRLSAYPTSLQTTSPGLTSGPYTAECYPGEDWTRGQRYSEKNIEGMMGSETLSKESRGARAAGMFFRKSIKEFAARYPNPTRQQTLENCIEVRTEAFERFSYPAVEKSAYDIAQSCEEDTARKFDAP